MRQAVEEWRDLTNDLGRVSERDLLEQWRPGGIWQVTAQPTAYIRDGVLVADCLTPGALIGWTYGEAAEPESTLDPSGGEIGQPDTDRRTWHIYKDGVLLDDGRSVVVKAWRLGFVASAETQLRP